MFLFGLALAERGEQEEPHDPTERCRQGSRIVEVASNDLNVEVAKLGGGRFASGESADLVAALKKSGGNT